MNGSGGYIDTNVVAIEMFFSFLVFAAIAIWIISKIRDKIHKRRGRRGGVAEGLPKQSAPKSNPDHTKYHEHKQPELVAVKKDTRTRPEYIRHINQIYQRSRALDIVVSPTSGSKLSKYEYKRKRSLMSDAERKFYEVLLVAVESDLVVFPQVHLDKFLDHRIVGQSYRGALSTIQRKSVDFLVCTHTHYVPVVAVELDDSTHNNPDRIERDKLVNEICAQAGMPLVRVRWSSQYSPVELRQLVRSKLREVYIS